jgi:branched-chain amino acid transport system permease protein
VGGDAAVRGARLVIGFLAFRFGISGVYFALLTIAFAEFTRIGFDHLDWLGGPGGMFSRWRSAIAGTCSTSAARRSCTTTRCCCSRPSRSRLLFLLKSRAAYYWQAIRENEEAAQALGINTFRWKMAAVALSAAMTSISGVFFAFYYNNLSRTRSSA